MNVLTSEWFKSTKNAEVVTEQREKEWRETGSKVTQMPGCLCGNFRKCPKKWPWHSPFWLDLSFYVCWGSSEIRWGLSHSSSLPWWSLTSQTSDTFSQRVTRDVFYWAVEDQYKLNFTRITYRNLLFNERHSIWCLWNLFSNEEEEHSLAQKGDNRHEALLTPSCKIQSNLPMKGHSGVKRHCWNRGLNV